MSVAACSIPAHLAHLSFDAWVDDPAQHAIATCPRCKRAVRITTVQRKQLVMARRYGEPCVSYRVSGYSPTAGVTQGFTGTFQMPCPHGCTRPGYAGPQAVVLYFKPIQGYFSDKVKCNAKCTSAKGPNCECACAGANHGSAHQG